MEKIHGTSCNVSISPAEIRFFKGGVDIQTRFESLFDKEKLRHIYNENFVDTTLTFYGEGYGGKMQGMSDVYGKDLRFVVFDVLYTRISDKHFHWLDVEAAHRLSSQFGFDFVWYKEVENTIDNLNQYRDQPSEQSSRLNISTNGESEGIVIRPLYECYDHNRGRYIVKHKRDKFRETASKRPVNTEVDLFKLEVLRKADEVANEWVTEMRLKHVMDKVQPSGMEDIPKLIAAMKEDVRRESTGEVDWTEEKQIYGHIAKKTSVMYKSYLMSKLEA